MVLAPMSLLLRSGRVSELGIRKVLGSTPVGRYFWILFVLKMLVSLTEKFIYH